MSARAAIGVQYLRLGTLSRLVAAADSPCQPLVPTEVEGIALLRGPRGRLHAVPRRCPHKDYDVVVYGGWAGDGELHCRHRGYRWCASSGELLGSGNTGPAGRLRLLDVVLDEHGVAWMRTAAPGRHR